MALISLRQLLDHAAEHGYGVPAFNVNNLEQVRAIMEAACELSQEGIVVEPEIMIPLVGFKAELADQLAIVHRVATEVMEKYQIKIDYIVGYSIGYSVGF